MIVLLGMNGNANTNVTTETGGLTETGIRALEAVAEVRDERWIGTGSESASPSIWAWIGTVMCTVDDKETFSPTMYEDERGDMIALARLGSKGMALGHGVRLKALTSGRSAGWWAVIMVYWMSRIGLVRGGH